MQRTRLSPCFLGDRMFFPLNLSCDENIHCELSVPYRNINSIEFLSLAGLRMFAQVQHTSLKLSFKCPSLKIIWFFVILLRGKKFTLDEKQSLVCEFKYFFYTNLKL